MLNRAILTGRLTRDTEVQYTQQGTPVLSFTLAVDRQFRNQNGEREADFVQCVIWRKGAENLAKFTHKGSKIGIDGHIQTRNYENNHGQRVYVTEVVVDNFALLDSRPQGQNGYQQNNRGYQQQPQGQPNNGYQQNQQPQQGQQQSPQPQQTQLGGNGWENTGAGQKRAQVNQQGQPQEVSDNDLPFPTQNQETPF